MCRDGVRVFVVAARRPATDHRLGDGLLEVEGVAVSGSRVEVGLRAGGSGGWRAPKHLDSPLGGDPVHGLWDRQVWQVVALVPHGRLATYGQIADLLGAWGRARQVGWALRRLPLPSTIPWHRVVNARGCIAMTPSREGSDWMQRDLLIAEGIPVDARGRLPLVQHRWHPPLTLTL